MDGSRAPIVVGSRQTYSAIRIERSTARSRVIERPRSATTIIVKIAVSPISTVVTATSFGVRGLFEDYQPNHFADVGILWVHRDPGGESVTDHSRSSDNLVSRCFPDGG